MAAQLVKACVHERIAFAPVAFVRCAFQSESEAMSSSSKISVWFCVVVPVGPRSLNRQPTTMPPFTEPATVTEPFALAPLKFVPVAGAPVAAPVKLMPAAAI